MSDPTQVSNTAITVPLDLKENQEFVVPINSWRNLDSDYISTFLRDNRLFLFGYNKVKENKTELITHVVLCKYDDNIKIRI